jgi:hypothetical protein
LKSISNDALLKRSIFLSSIILFLLSLSQDTFCTNDSCNGDWDGMYVLLLGALGAFASPAGIAWLANPAIFGSWATLKKNPKTSLILSLIAVAFSASFLLFSKVVKDESGDPRQITAYKSGYWMWLLSMIIMVIGNLILFLRNRFKRPQ